MKKKDLIESLKRLAADVAAIAEALEGKPEEAPAIPAQAAPAEGPAKEEAKAYSLEQVRGILADKARAGYRAEVKTILSAHGAERLSDITDPEELSLVAREAEVILDTSELYSGIYGRASINFYAFNSNGNRGIACGLNNLQKLADGEPLGGHSRAEDDFADEDDEDFLS